MGGALKSKQIINIEKYVNNVIERKLIVKDDVVPLDEAKKIPGVCAVFGEVYPDPVRVITVVGMENEKNSVEFCAGTHLKNTKDAELFVIIEETAVAKGIRRITALTRDAAKEAKQLGEKIENEISKVENEDIKSSEELESISISTSLKTKLRTRLDTLQKKSIDMKKEI